MASGKAGRTDYGDWEKKTSSLLSNLEKETKQEIEEAKEALGLQDGKYAHSEAEAKEQQKQKDLNEKKTILTAYRERELGVVQVLESLLSPSSADAAASTDSSSIKRFVTRNDIEAGKRVLNITNTTGPGQIILTQDLTNLECKVPANNNASSSSLTPKSYPQDAENGVPEQIVQQQMKNRTIHGLIKISITNVHDCTISLRCKVITGLLEISHCSNVILKLCQESTIVTVQADLCDNLDIQFHDAPSGKSLPSHLGVGGANHKVMYWGDDKDDRIFHAGVSNLKVGIYKEGYAEHETSFDYKTNGKAKAAGNATAEEVQFVTSVVNDTLLTEKVLRQGSATGTTVAGGVGNGSDSAGGSARPMTAREMKEVERRKEQIRKAVDERLGGNIKIMDKDGNEVQADKKSTNDETKEVHVEEKEKEEGVTEEIYTSMSSSEIDSIVKDCEAQKSKGNEAFVSGEYAQAVLLYTLALDRAAELPDAISTTANSESSSQQLFPRHIVLSNRSASFLKLGHHEKAFADGCEAERLDPSYVKGIFRKGLALHAMGRYQEALTSLSAASKIEPKNKQIKQALQFAEVRFQQEMRKRMSG